MGMFDTLILDPPLVCPRCAKVHGSMQTKSFDSTLSVYRPGMIIPGCPVHSGILKDHTWCCETETEKNEELSVWLILWHGIFAGYALDAESAELRLAKLDRLDLLGWLDRMQKRAEKWEARYHSLYRDLSNWIEYRDLDTEEKALVDKKPGEGKAKKFRTRLLFIHLPEEIRNDPDPLRRILERNTGEAEVEPGMFGW